MGAGFRTQWKRFSGLILAGREVNLLLDVGSVGTVGVGFRTPWERFSGLIPLRDDFVDP